VSATQQADARFLRRIFIGLIVLTVFTGTMAGVATVGAMASEGMDFCQATGFLCQN